MEDYYIYEILKKLEKNHFIDLLITIESLIVLILLLQKRDQSKLHFAIAIYTLPLLYLFSFGSDINLATLYKNNYSLKKTILEIGNIGFALFEFISFYLIIQPSVMSKARKKIIAIIFKMFLIYYFTILLSIILTPLNFKSITNNASSIITFELLSLFIFCILFFVDLIDKNRIRDPTNLSKLLIINSIFFYISISLPFMYIILDIKTTHRTEFKLLSLLHYSSIIILLSTIIYVLKNHKPIKA